MTTSDSTRRMIAAERESALGQPPEAVKAPFTRSQRTTIVYGILCIVLVLVILQLWLLTATMDAYLGGDDSVPVPAAIVSIVCFLLGFGLLRYLYRLDRRR